MLDFLEGKTFQLKGSILGFEDCNLFTATVVDEDGHFAYLQSAEQEYVGFLVVSPFTFNPDYSIEIEEKDKQLLDIQAPEEVCVLSIVTTVEPFSDSTMNLLAPILLNVKNGQGKQIVLPPKSRYGTQEPLFNVIPLEVGE